MPVLKMDGLAGLQRDLHCMFKDRALCSAYREMKLRGIGRGLQQNFASMQMGSRRTDAL